MRKNTVFAVTAALVLGLTQVGYAEYVSGFKVVEATETQLVIKKGDDAPVTVKIEKGEYKVGDEVRYDAEKLVVKKVRPKAMINGC